jgi:hypothetical protein
MLAARLPSGNGTRPGDVWASAQDEGREGEREHVELCGASPLAGLDSFWRKRL